MTGRKSDVSTTLLGLGRFETDLVLFHWNHRSEVSTGGGYERKDAIYSMRNIVLLFTLREGYLDPTGITERTGYLISSSV